MNQTGYLLHEKEKSLESKRSGKKNDFSSFVEEKRKELAKLEGRKIATKDLAGLVGIDYEQFRKIVNKQKPTKKRDFIIALCAVLQVDSEITNEALLLYGMPPLNTEYPRYDELINILEEQLEEPVSIQEINNRLIRNDYPPLNIIGRKGGDMGTKVKYPYTLLKKRVECRTDDLYYGDPYDSLQTAYEPDRYRIVANMWLDDKQNRRRYKLTADGTKYIREDYPFNEKSIHVYHDIDETEEFRDCFIELKSMVKSERKVMADYLQDTRNYYERKSARIIDDCLHVYYEKYNYTVPELGEYYLMDYSNGVYTLSVSKKSRFMHLYLPTDVYATLYNRVADDEIAEVYDSVGAIKKYYLQKSKEAMLMKMRISAYEKMKLELTAFIKKLKDGEIHIRSVARILENRYAVLQYYGVAYAFDCECGEELEFIADAKKDIAVFKATDGSETQLTVTDLEKAFELGLDTIEDIVSFISKSGSLDISQLL